MSAPYHIGKPPGSIFANERAPPRTIGALLKVHPFGSVKVSYSPRTFFVAPLPPRRRPFGRLARTAR
jgi:hypothetical protein